MPTISIKAGQYQDENEKPSLQKFALLVPLEEQGGYIFALAQINNSSEEENGIFNLLDEHMERFARSLGRAANLQHRFEQFLSALNEQVAQKVREGEWDFPIQNLQAIVGIISENQMFLSGSGDLFALFLQRKNTGRYQVFNLSRSIHTEQALPTWEKAFAVVLDGDIHPGDVFCLCNRDLQQTISNDEILTVLTRLPPSGACEKVRQYFSHNTELAVMVIQVVGEEAPTLQTAQPQAGLSVEHLQETEAETVKYLEDQRPTFFSAMINMLRKNQKPESGTRGFLRKNKHLLIWVMRHLWHFSKILAHGSQTLAMVIFQKNKRTNAVSETKQRMDRSLSGVVNRFNRLPQTSKYLMMAAVGVLFIFLVSLTFLTRAHTRSEARQVYEDEIIGIQTMLDQAAGAIIYKDERKAQDLYNQAAKGVEKLAEDTPERLIKKNELRTQVQAGVRELQHTVLITEPSLVGWITENNPPGRILFKEEKGLALLTEDKQVYRFDQTTKSFSAVPVNAEAVGGAPKNGTVLKSTLYFLDSRPAIDALDLHTATFQTASLTVPVLTDWVDIFAYANRLYILEPASGTSEGQVIRYTPNGSEFGAGRRWIQSKITDLSDAVSLAVDSSVFVLKRNGVVVRYTNGSEASWSLEAVEPAIQEATDLWTDDTTSYMYVLEPAGKRLLIYEKENGKFVVQYTSPAFENLTDFIVDEAQKTIYLLAGHKVFGIAANHLN